MRFKSVSQPNRAVPFSRPRGPGRPASPSEGDPMSGWDRKGWATGMLTAGLVWSGGVAAAAPPVEPAGFRSVADQAAAVLRGSAGSDLLVLTGIFAEAGSATETFVDIFV